HQEGDDAPPDLGQGNAAELLHNEQIHADGRRDQADLYHHQGDNAEPEGDLFMGQPGKRQADDDRVEDRNGQEDHGQRVHDATEHQVDQQDRHQHGHGRKAAGLHPGRQLDRHACQRQAAVEQVGTDDDQIDHGSGFRGATQTLVQPLTAHAAAKHGIQAAGSRADGGGFGQVGPATVNAVDDDDEHHHHG